MSILNLNKCHLIFTNSVFFCLKRFIILTVLLGEGIIAADIITFIAIGIPFIIVYEMSLGVVVLIEKRREKQEKNYSGQHLSNF